MRKLQFQSFFFLGIFERLYASGGFLIALCRFVFGLRIEVLSMHFAANSPNVVVIRVESRYGALC